MSVEIGIKQVGRSLTFTTGQSADSVMDDLNAAIANSSTAQLTDAKGRRILIPGSAVGYAIVGTQTVRPLGFGPLNQ
ncbi:MAG: DUF3107 domain-containing protein [Aeriscardovia sp.]|nr:DUF3107 domain-containing protein [Aeriscardovia sp.]